MRCKESTSMGWGGIDARPTIETVTTNATLNVHGDQNYRQSRKNRSDSIICMTCNAQSLIPKKDELILNTQLYKPLIIGVTETWANGEMEDGSLKLDGYVMYRSDRIGRRGGGTILYVASKLGQRECVAMRQSTRGIPFENSSWCWVTPTMQR